MSGLLVAREVCRSFGALRAVDNVSLTIESGARHAIIGPNGAGKSTLFALFAGGLPLTSGRLELAGRDITGIGNVGRARLGVQQTFQHSSLFDSVTALENVAIAVQHTRSLSSRWWRSNRRYPEIEQAASSHLHRVGLGARAQILVSRLSHGERRQLEIAVALARMPRLLLLDEPTAGMSAAETARFTESVGELPDDVTIVFVEHDLDVVFQLATTVTVLDLGAVVDTGTPENIAHSAAVQAAYLSGAGAHDVFSPDYVRGGRS
ncbi:ABC transporter ATP-binding protein [Kibdelosporangium aridum]|uniref:ABC transporter ATP-binding protein n=1 Tax=Kibdelosporangium aridum TaxID=2030 RepID=UPI0035E55E56